MLRVRHASSRLPRSRTARADGRPWQTRLVDGPGQREVDARTDNIRRIGAAGRGRRRRWPGGGVAHPAQPCHALPPLFRFPSRIAVHQVAGRSHSGRSLPVESKVPPWTAGRAAAAERSRVSAWRVDFCAQAAAESNSRPKAATKRRGMSVVPRPVAMVTRIIRIRSATRETIKENRPAADFRPYSGRGCELAHVNGNAGNAGTDELQIAFPVPLDGQGIDRSAGLDLPRRPRTIPACPDTGTEGRAGKFSVRRLVTSTNSRMRPVPAGARS